MSVGLGVHLWGGFGEEFWSFLGRGGFIRSSHGFAFSGFPWSFTPKFCFLFCRVLSAMLMQSMSLESTRLIPENMSPDRFHRGFCVSGFCYTLDELRADYASLIHPSIDRETRSTPSRSFELTTLGHLIDMR